jgi:ketosteroid isomerase-like protein
MSRENLETVQRVYDAVARHDTATVLAQYDREVVHDNSRLPEASLVGERVTHGHDGLRRLFREWYEAWEYVEDDCEELIDAGEHVVSVVTRRGRGRASGAETTARRGGVWTLREGKIVRVVWFASPEEALEAAGLSE